MNVDVFTADNLPSPDSVGKGGVVYDGSRLRVSDGDAWIEDVTVLDDLTVTGDIIGQIVPVSYVMNANASLADQAFFVADRAYQVVSIREVHSVAGSDGGAVTLQVTKDDATDAPGAGVDLLSAGFDLKGTANTVQSGALSATAADLLLAAGDRLAVDFAGTLTAVVGVVVTVVLKTV